MRMIPNEQPAEEDLAVEVTKSQVEHFRGADPNCRVMQLPEGLLLRYNLSHALYFYLRTGVSDGKISTRVFASDSPYEPKKNDIGEVRTPMFEAHADVRHLQKVERLLRDWVGFVRDDPNPAHAFTAFSAGREPG